MPISLRKRKMAGILFMLYLLRRAERLDSLEREAERREERRRRQVQAIRWMYVSPANDEDYIRMYRLNSPLVDMLEADLIPYLPVEISQRGVSHRMKILSALSFLATGIERSTGTNANTYLTNSAVSRHFRAVLDALCQPSVIAKYMRFPNHKHERDGLKGRYHRQYKLPGVVGCAGATLVAMARPARDSLWFDCGSGFYARSLMIITDADCNIQHADVTFGGTTCDNYIFDSSAIKRHTEQLCNDGDTTSLLGHTGFAQQECMMVPFTDPEPNTPEHYYNKLHSEAMMTTERTFRLMKDRFQCLLPQRALHFNPVIVSKIAIACCLLHNICNYAGLPVPSLPSDVLMKENEILQTYKNKVQPREHDTQRGLLARSRLVEEIWAARTNQSES